MDRLSELGEFRERTGKQAPLLRPADARNDDDETGVKRLRGIKTAEIAGVVRNQNQTSLAGIARDVPVFPASPHFSPRRRLASGAVSRSEAFAEGGSAAA